VQVPYVWKPSHEKWMCPDRRLRLVIWGFFDESGKLLNADDFICLAGYIADENWDGLTSEWGLLLKQHSLPSLHMARLLNRKPPFEKINWSDDEQKEILRQFVSVIRKHTAAFCCVSLDAKHYRSLPREVREQFGQKTAIDFSFQRLLRLVIQRLQSWQIEYPISLNFDYEEQASLVCIRTLAKLRSHREEIKKLIGAITFCDSSVYYPLQAADMLAYGTYQHLHGSTLDYMEPLAFKPMNPGPIPSSEHYTAKSLDSIFDKFKKGEITRLA
jgi:hypothetical protein